MLFHRSEYAKVPLEPFGIVVLNKILNHSNQAGPVGEAFSVIPLSFQDAPESFHWSVINAFGNSGHALGHTGFGQHTVEYAVGVLKSSVTVAQRVCIGICFNRCPKCIKYQWIVVGIPNHVADNPSVIQIQDSTEIDFLDLNANIVLEFSNICEPFLVGFICFEFPIQQIVCEVKGILALPGTSMVAVLNGGFNPAAPADPKHPLVINMGFVAPIQFIFKSAVSHLWMFFVDILNQISNAFVLSSPGG